MAATGGWPLKASAARANDCAMAMVCTMSSSLRLSLRSAIRPAKGPSDQDRAELSRGQDAERDAAVGELQHEQGLGHEREPVADLGDHLAGEEQAEVADAQRLEGVAWSRCRNDFTACPSSRAARARRARPRVAVVGRRRARPVVPSATPSSRLRSSASRSSPASSGRHARDAAVVGIGGAVDETVGSRAWSRHG